MEEDLAESVYYLMARGHPLKEIWGYTLSQLNSFVELAAGEEKREHSAMVRCARIAYHADGKQYKEVMRTLEG